MKSKFYVLRLSHWATSSKEGITAFFIDGLNSHVSYEEDSHRASCFLDRETRYNKKLIKCAKKVRYFPIVYPVTLVQRATGIF